MAVVQPGSPSSSRPMDVRGLRGALAFAVCLNLLFWLAFFRLLPPTHALSALSPYLVQVDLHAPQGDHRPSPGDIPPAIRGAPLQSARASFAVQVAPSTPDLALLITHFDDNISVYLNGRLIQMPSGVFGVHVTHEGEAPLLLDLTTEAPRVGANRVDLMVLCNGCRPRLGRVYFGPKVLLRPAMVFYQFGSVTLPLVTAVASGTLLLLALSLIPIAAYGRLPFALAGLAGTVALDAWLTSWSGTRPDYATYVLVRYLNQYLIFLSVCFFLNAMADRSRRHGIAFISIYGVIFSILLMCYLFCGDIAQIYPLMDTICIILMAIYTIYSVFYIYRIDRPDAVRLGGIFFLGVGSCAYDAAGYITGNAVDGQFRSTALSPLFMVAALGVEIALRGYRLHRLAAADYSEAQARLLAQADEIRISYDKLREQERLNVVNLERQRLIRDMHDGVGGQLIGIATHLKDNEMPRPAIRQAIQAALDDLRHIIDSSDSVGDSLDVAIAIFSERIGPRLGGANIAFHWHNMARDPVVGLSPNQVLNIYRILQEGVANAMKHSGATAVELSLSDTLATDVVVITLADNGVGLPVTGAAAPSGRGFANMRQRAAHIGARFLADSRPGEGVRLTLEIPRPASATPDP
jgi:signal transduction histidine kinase